MIYSPRIHICTVSNTYDSKLAAGCKPGSAWDFWRPFFSSHCKLPGTPWIHKTLGMHTTGHRRPSRSHLQLDYNDIDPGWQPLGKSCGPRPVAPCIAHPGPISKASGSNRCHCRPLIWGASRTPRWRKSSRCLRYQTVVTARQPCTSRNLEALCIPTTLHQSMVLSTSQSPRSP